MEGTALTCERRYDDFYRRLRTRVSAWLGSDAGQRYRFARHLLLVPDLFHLVVRLMLDSRVPKNVRSQLFGAAVYVVSPADLLPEALLGPVGFADDVVLLALIVHRLLGSVPRELVVEHWAGDRDLIIAIQDVLEAAEAMVGGRVWRRLKALMGGDGAAE